MADFTQKIHRSVYDAISPTAPQNSQAGRTVLITGASAGIGFSIAEAYSLASAAKIILLSRRPDALEQAVSSLQRSLASRGSSGVIESIVCDIRDQDSLAGVWEQLAAAGTSVDVLVLNAAQIDDAGGAPGAIAYFEVNVIANIRLVDQFLRQGPAAGKAVVNISSAAAHSNPAAPKLGTYAASKAGFASWLSHMAEDVTAAQVQMVNVHPGVVFTPSAKTMGFTEDMFPWDDAELPGAFSVWATTKQAEFLHGRFVWAAWDVDELTGMKERILADPGLLKIGLQGVSHFGVAGLKSDGT
ncbi:hypothetical protein MBLNU459_g8325t1 [Dothideomycetes sp. NU459]